MKLIFATCFFVTCFVFVDVSYGAQPVLIEMYGSSYKCDASKDVEKKIREILADNSDAVFLNCRLKNPVTVKEAEPFGQEFCNQGRLGYFRSLETMVLNMPMVVVNGRYEANSDKIDAAIKAALSLDRVQRINIRRNGSALEINLDATSPPAIKGSLFLYTYLPLEFDAQQNSEDPGSIDGDTYISTASSAVAFHPVVNLAKLSEWDGKPFSFSHSLSGLVDMAYDPGSLGYIAVLHDSDSSGPVLAVGELKPDKTSVSFPLATADRNQQKSDLPVTLPNQ